MERIHNVNLKSLKEVNTWDTKRVKTYMIRIQKHISYLENNFYHDPLDDNIGTPEEIKNDLEKFKNYKIQLKKILNTRENIN